MIKVLHLGLSYACNLNCMHCFVDKADDKLTKSDYFDIIDTLYNNGLIVVVYTYGEPLLSKKFYDVSAYAKEKGISQILMTNGTLINEEVVKKLKDLEINKVYISIDNSDPIKHDRNRGSHGSYQKAINAIKLLKRNGIHVGLSTTITNENILNLPNIHRLALDLNVDSISYLTERSEHKVVNFDDKNAYADFFKGVILDKSVNVIFHDNYLKSVVFDLYEENKIDELGRDYILEMFSCKNNYTLCIHPDGKMSKCNFIEPLKYKYSECDLNEYIKSEEFKNENTICYS